MDKGRRFYREAFVMIYEVRMKEVRLNIQLVTGSRVESSQGKIVYKLQKDSNRAGEIKPLRCRAEFEFRFRFHKVAFILRYKFLKLGK